MSLRLVPEATDEQRMLLEAVVRVIESGCPLPTVRELAERGEPGDAALRRKLADLGCFGLLVGEERGGGSLSGNGVVDAALVAAERGARLQPGPFVGTSVVAYTLSQAGTAPAHRERLDALVAGESSATWAADGIFGAATTGLTVREVTDGFELSGTVPAVQDADECDTILVSSRRSTQDGGAGVRHILLDPSSEGMSLTPAEGMDITRRFFSLRLDAVRVPAAASLVGDAAALLERQVALAAVLSSAESVGAMDANFRLALDYAKTRIAFGRPIGSFQALKHQLADTSLALEMSKGLVAGSAAALGSGAADGLAMAGIARSFVSEHAVQLTHTCFQVFGGIGYTWEHDQHLFMRRLAAEAYQYGAPSWHRRRLWQQAVPADDGTEGEADA